MNSGLRQSKSEVREVLIFKSHLGKRRHRPTSINIRIYSLDLQTATSLPVMQSKKRAHFLQDNYFVSK